MGKKEGKMTIRSFWLRLHVASVCNKRIYKMVLRTGTPLQYASVQEPILGLFTLFEKPAFVDRPVSVQVTH